MLRNCSQMQLRIGISRRLAHTSPFRRDGGCCSFSLKHRTQRLCCGRELLPCVG